MLEALTPLAYLKLLNSTLNAVGSEIKISPNPISLGFSLETLKKVGDILGAEKRPGTSEVPFPILVFALKLDGEAVNPLGMFGSSFNIDIGS